MADFSKDDSMADFSRQVYIAIENRILAGQLLEANRLLDKLLDLNPDNAILYHLKLLAVFEQHNSMELNRVIALVQMKFPNSFLSCLAGGLRPGISAFQRKRQLDKSIRMGGNDFYTYYLRGWHAYLSGSFQDAIADLDICVARNRNFFRAMTLRSLCYIELGKNDKALDDMFSYWMMWVRAIDRELHERAACDKPVLSKASATGRLESD